MSEWQPIETAPKHDTVLLCTKHGEIIIGWWETGREFPGSEHFNDWSSGSFGEGSGYDCGFKRVYDPTHWMPLPVPPTTTTPLGG